MGMTDDQVNAYLGHVRALIGTAQSKPGDAETEHAMVTDLFPGFVAAVEAVLKLHQPVTTNGGWLEGREWQECGECGPNNGCEHVIAVPGQGESFWPCPTVEAITAALAGKEEP